jgi:exopolysaccharide biosynthesis protein
VRIVVKGGLTSTKVSSFVRDNDLIAGINAAPFDIISSREGRPITSVGIIVSEGKLAAPAIPQYDALVIYKDGRAAIVSQSSIQSIENIENAVGGFYQILVNNELAPRIYTSNENEAVNTITREVRHPRSAAGISSDGKYLYLLVIDGRRTGSIGATEIETAMLLRALGSQDGINFDGGGSSALVLRFPDGITRVVNNPVHNGIPGRERAVGGCLGVGRR